MQMRKEIAEGEESIVWTAEKLKGMRVEETLSDLKTERLLVWKSGWENGTRLGLNKEWWVERK